MGEHTLDPDRQYDCRDRVGGGKADRQGLTGGMEHFGGSRAGVLMDSSGATVFDTQGISRFQLLLPQQNPEAEERIRLAYLRWEKMHCTDCGVRVWEGAIFCRECRPYGFWHWLAFYSPIAWRRTGRWKPEQVNDHGMEN